MTKLLMCHVVAGYPSRKGCLELMQGMHHESVVAIEVQIPFSDPIADGEIIMQANDVALASGMTTAGSFDLLKTARNAGVDTDIYIMSYLQKVGHFGLAEFCSRAADCDIKGLIIPDLPYDTPEYDNLRKLTAKYGMQLVPVLTLEALLAKMPAAVYVTSSQGITGKEYAPTSRLRELTATIKKQSKATIMIGFGVNTAADVSDVLDIGDIAVVGSSVIKKIRDSGVAAALTYIGSLVPKS